MKPIYFVPFGCFPKNRGGPPKSSIVIGFSIIFTIHFGGFPSIFGKYPDLPRHRGIFCLSSDTSIQLNLDEGWHWGNLFCAIYRDYYFTPCLNRFGVFCGPTTPRFQTPPRAGGVWTEMFVDVCCGCLLNDFLRCNMVQPKKTYKESIKKVDSLRMGHISDGSVNLSWFLMCF